MLVFVFSAAFIAYAPKYMGMLNEFSADLSAAILDTGTKVLSVEKDEKDSVVLIRDSLFAMQIEKPWLLLQYGTTDKEAIGVDRVERLLSVSPSLHESYNHRSSTTVRNGVIYIFVKHHHFYICALIDWNHGVITDTVFNILISACHQFFNIYDAGTGK